MVTVEAVKNEPTSDMAERARTKRGTPLAERFAAKYVVDKDTGCWVWTAHRTPSGYGQIFVRNRTRAGAPSRRGHGVRAHRVAWEMFRGEIPDGMVVCHRCDNPPCVNPDHLFLGTHADNQRDKDQKGRVARGIANARAKLNDQAVVDIRNRHAAGASKQSIARHYGVTPRVVFLVLTGQTWRHVA